jgi:hypothetical protein
MIKLRSLFFIVVAAIAACGGGGSENSDRSPTNPTSDPSATAPQLGATFSDATAASGIDHEFSIFGEPSSLSLTWPERFGGGLAVVDIDSDDDLDLYLVAGDGSPNAMYRNDGGNKFTDIAASIGLDLIHKGSGPAFADIDGDRDPDLFIGSVEGDFYYLLRNDAGMFVDMTATSGIQLSALNTFSSTFGDYDMDGDLDMVLTHWQNPESADTETLWENNGDGTYFSASIPSGLSAELLAQASNEPPGVFTDYSFSAIFSDLEGDGDPDLVVAADFKTSQVLRNNGDGTFTSITDRSVIVDDSGMGTAVGDYDNDGDMDWFVTAIYQDPSQPGAMLGNRLYQNQGDGSFIDVSDQAGIADGGWGWGACMEDFDNDGDLDIFHVNGSDTRDADEYNFDRIRYFQSNGDGTFNELAAEVGLLNLGQGRGVACFDSDRDGDLDIYITNNDYRSSGNVFYVNELDNGYHYLTVRLEGAGRNTAGIGARVEVSGGSVVQVREIRGGNNYVSQNAAEAHFGLGETAIVDVIVRWPDGTVSELNGIAANQLLTVSQ